MNLLILQAVEGSITDFVLKLLSMLGPPSLILFILGLMGAIYYFIKEKEKLNIKLADKEIQIQTLNNAAMESTVKNLEIIHDISSTIDKSDDRGRVLESLLMENNTFLKSILRSLNI